MVIGFWLLRVLRYAAKKCTLFIVDGTVTKMPIYIKAGTN
jgi:hypothetical protein